MDKQEAAPPLVSRSITYTKDYVRDNCTGLAREHRRGIVSWLIMLLLLWGHGSGQIAALCTNHVRPEGRTRECVMKETTAIAQRTTIHTHCLERHIQL